MNVETFKITNNRDLPAEAVLIYYYAGRSRIRSIKDENGNNVDRVAPSVAKLRRKVASGDSVFVKFEYEGEPVSLRCYQCLQDDVAQWGTDADDMTVVTEDRIIRRRGTLRDLRQRATRPGTREIVDPESLKMITRVGGYFTDLDERTSFDQIQKQCDDGVIQPAECDALLKAVRATTDQLVERLRIRLDTIVANWDGFETDKVPAALPDVDNIKRFSDLQLDLLRQHFPGGPPYGINIGNTRQAYSLFASGQLAPNAADNVGQPDSALIFCFAEFALAAAMSNTISNTDRQAWSILSTIFVAIQEIYTRTYGCKAGIVCSERRTFSMHGPPAAALTADDSNFIADVLTRYKNIPTQITQIYFAMNLLHACPRGIDV